MCCFSTLLLKVLCPSNWKTFLAFRYLKIWEKPSVMVLCSVSWSTSCNLIWCQIYARRLQMGRCVGGEGREKGGGSESRQN